jgi:hypothetical protein
MLFMAFFGRQKAALRTADHCCLLLLLLLRLVCLRLSRPENKKEKADRLKAEAEAREAGKVRHTAREADGQGQLGQLGKQQGFVHAYQQLLLVGRADAGASAQLAAAVGRQAAAVAISSGDQRFAAAAGIHIWLQVALLEAADVGRRQAGGGQSGLLCQNGQLQAAEL